MESIYTAAFCEACDTEFRNGIEALSESFIRKTIRDNGDWFKCPICSEGLLMQTSKWDDSKSYMVVRYMEYRSADGMVRSDVVWTNCEGSWNNAVEQHEANMAKPDVSVSRIVQLMRSDYKEVADKDIPTISNL
jgi:hypothetical protein